MTPKQLRNGYIQTDDRILLCTTQDIADSQRVRVKNEEIDYLERNEMDSFESEEARMQFRKEVCRDKLETPFYADRNAPDFFDKPNATCPMHAQLRVLDKHTSAVPNYIHNGDCRLYLQPRDAPTYGEYLDDPTVVSKYETEWKESEFVSKGDGVELYIGLMKSYPNLGYMKKQLQSAVGCDSWPCVITGMYAFYLFLKCCGFY